VRELAEWRLLSKGAEATIYVGKFLGLPAIRKVRHPKAYRSPDIDIMLRTLRTRREAKLLVLAKAAGVLVPFVYDVDIHECSIIMEYIKGILLRDYIKHLESQGLLSTAFSLVEEAGRILAKLHSNRILHGDYTTSNIIVSNGRLFVIDFGLGAVSMTNDLEDYAVELRVFSRGLEVYHSENYDEYVSSFLSGYRKFRYCEEVIERFEEIFRRGRYVAERRTRKIFLPQNRQTR